jgi:upstream activation factor subunit UAF30
MGKTKVKQEEALQAEIEKMLELIKKESEGGSLNPKSCSALTKQVENIKKYTAYKKQVKKVGQNSGLKKPIKISKEMCKFAGWKFGEEHSRVDVTSAICEYIRENNLQNPENRREILLDDTLKSLLEYKEEKITYPHIQKYINIHFLKE